MCASKEQWGVKLCEWTAYTDSHKVKCHFSQAAPTVTAPADTKQRQPHRPSPFLAGTVWKHKESLMQEEGRTDRGPTNHRRGAAMWDTERRK